MLPPPAPLPSPTPLPQSPLICLPGPLQIGPKAGLGFTTGPSAQIQKEYEDYIERTVDPENVLNLVIGLPKLMVFKKAPKRVQMGDDQVVSLETITPTELSLLGKMVGKTVLNVWVDDLKAPGKQRILSYLLRVSPDFISPCLCALLVLNVFS
jgi:pilus assembly protein CpaC